MSDLYIKVKSAAAGSAKGLLPLKTGQVTSYATNDDGDLEKGRLTGWSTSSYYNPFGGYERFTNQTGSQTFGDGIVIDWSTWDGGSSVNGYCHNKDSDTSGTQNWANWMSNQPYSSSVFGGWYLVNFQELSSLCNMEEQYALNGYPFYITVTPTQRCYSSTTYPTSTNQALHKRHNVAYIGNLTKTTATGAMLIRTFTVSGTTLT